MSCDVTFSLGSLTNPLLVGRFYISMTCGAESGETRSDVLTAPPSDTLSCCVQLLSGTKPPPITAVLLCVCSGLLGMRHRKSKTSCQDGDREAAGEFERDRLNAGMETRITGTDDEFVLFR